MIKPFNDDEAASSIGDLTIENGTAKVLISGSLEISRDVEGLSRARALKQLAENLVAELEAQDLPKLATGAQTAAIDKVENPFV